MPRTLVTGATGFIGSHVVRALLRRGDEVRVTVRRTSGLEGLEGLDVESVRADVTDRRAVRRALDDVERVFHVAGTTNLRLPAAEAYRINVDGTRVVLEECLRAGVERTVHVSSVAAVGPAPAGGAVDERHVHRGGRTGIPYVDSKREAEAQALRVAARGLPVVIACPAHVLGRGDHHRSSTDVVRRFMLRRIPAYTDGRSTSSTSRTWRRASCSLTSGARPASAICSAIATTPGSACSRTSPACRGSIRRR